MHSIGLVPLLIIFVIVVSFENWREIWEVVKSFSIEVFELFTWLLRGAIRLLILWPLGFYQRGECHKLQN